MRLDELTQDKYEFLFQGTFRSIDVLEYMINTGWVLREIRCNTREFCKVAPVSHILRLTRDEFCTMDIEYQIVIFNSNRQFRFGLFTGYCDRFSGVKPFVGNFGHLYRSGMLFDSFRRKADRFYRAFVGVRNKVERLRFIEPSFASKMDLARFANGLRYCGGNARIKDPQCLLTGRLDTFFSLFNTIYAQLIGGGEKFLFSNGKKRRITKINSVRREIEFSTGLWEAMGDIMAMNT
jgi:hypothetical protein